MPEKAENEQSNGDEQHVEETEKKKKEKESPAVKKSELKVKSGEPTEDEKEKKKNSGTCKDLKKSELKLASGEPVDEKKDAKKSELKLKSGEADEKEKKKSGSGTKDAKKSDFKLKSPEPLEKKKIGSLSKEARPSELIAKSANAVPKEKKKGGDATTEDQEKKKEEKKKKRRSAEVTADDQENKTSGVAVKKKDGEKERKKKRDDGDVTADDEEARSNKKRRREGDKEKKRKKEDAETTADDEALSPRAKADEKRKKKRDSCEKTVESEESPTPSPGGKIPKFRRELDNIRMKIDKLRRKTRRKTNNRDGGESVEELATTEENRKSAELEAKTSDEGKEKEVSDEKESTRAPKDKDSSRAKDKESARALKKPYEKMIRAEQKTLSKLEWYHGLMPREEIEDLLKNDGDFCLRKTDVGKRERYALSVCWKQKVRHILPRLTIDSKWTFRDVEFDKVEKLLIYYITSKAEIQSIGTKLLNPVHRPDWYVLHEHVILKKKLGSGNFGDVFLADLCNGNEKTPVAVKTLRGKLGKTERAQFVKEASLTRRFSHPNIVRILGVAPQQEPIMIMLELATGGCLKSHCRDKIDLTPAQLTRYCLDAASGMEYLSEHLIIHRDIAARNCLLGEKDVVKISDFGLSVADHTEVKEVKLRNVPVKWLAPETLSKGIFTTKSDVWSFGIMMWEVYIRCKKDPYPGMTNKETRAMVLTEARMDPPSETPEKVAKLMTQCWMANPEERPDWSEIVKRLSEEVGVEPQKVQKDKSLACQAGTKAKTIDKMVIEQWCW